MSHAPPATPDQDDSGDAPANGPSEKCPPTDQSEPADQSEPDDRPGRPRPMTVRVVDRRDREPDGGAASADETPDEASDRDETDDAPEADDAAAETAVHAATARAEQVADDRTAAVWTDAWSPWPLLPIGMLLGAATVLVVLLVWGVI